MILIPDEIQGDVYEAQIKPNLRDGQSLLYLLATDLLFIMV